MTDTNAVYIQMQEPQVSVQLQNNLLRSQPVVVPAPVAVVQQMPAFHLGKACTYGLAGAVLSLIRPPEPVSAPG